MQGSFFNVLKQWYFKAYEAEKREAERSVVARFARGNVLVQEAHYLDERELAALSKRGDDAMKRLEKSSA